MTLRTGKRKDVKVRSGFTLIELMLVMAMLMIVLGVAAPSLSNFFRFVSLTRYGQSRAVSEGVPVMLWIDAKQGAYGLQQEAGYTDLDTKAVDFDLNKDLVIEVTDLPLQTAQMGQVRQPQSNLPMIRFRPDGFIGETSPRTVVISENKGDAVFITQSRNRLNYEIQTSQLQSGRR